MSKIEDGGPVFPFIHTGVKGGAMHTEQRSGISLRDHFASQALIGIGTWMPGGLSLDLTRPNSLRARAEWAYAQADAMIAARKGGEA